MKTCEVASLYGVKLKTVYQRFWKYGHFHGNRPTGFYNSKKVGNRHYYWDEKEVRLNFQQHSSEPRG